MINASRSSFQGSSRSAAPPAVVWAVWTDPAAWPGDIVEAATLHGSFEVGGKITTKIKGYPAGTSTITTIDSPRLWVGVARSPGLTLTYEHIVEPAGDGALLTERATMSGPLAWIAARILGRRLEATFASTTAHCARLAEQRSLS